MNKIITIQQAAKLSKKLKSENKKVVLVGGCFDILHIGHVQFLQKAKAKGDMLFVMLETDERIRKTKGKDRPIHTQKQRALVLSAMESVDVVILLAYLQTDKEYDRVVKRIQPAIIATTKGDKMVSHKKRQAKSTGSKLMFVNSPIKTISTSTILSQFLSDTSI